MHLQNEPTASPAEGIGLMGRTLQPDAVAAMVLNAIRANQLYVITHEESLDPLRKRFQRMERAVVELKRPS